MADKIYGFLQTLEIVSPDEKSDLEVFGQYYKVPKSGMSPVVDSSYGTYKYDFGKKEIVLLSADDNGEVFRKKVDPKLLAKSEYKWIKLAKEEARLNLGLDDIY